MPNKVKILIVDDKYEKVQSLIALMEGIVDSSQFEHSTNTRDALRNLRESSYDLLIIDLQIPEALGDRINIYGGKNLLEYLDHDNKINKPTHILGLTEHLESFEKCESSFKSKGWSLLIYEQQNKDLIKSIITAKIKHVTHPPKNYDVAILTALEKTELEAVLKLQCNWIPIKQQNDCNIYQAGQIKSSCGKEISLIATSCHHMGLAHATATSMKMCIKFNPKYIIMTGIAAGIKDKVKLGDILIADPTWDWGSGKQTIKQGKPVFLSSPRQITMDPHLRAKLRSLATNRKYLEEIYNNAHVKPQWALDAHLGPVATGAAVLEDPSIVEMIQSQHRETIGIEMEAYGVALASSISNAKPPIPIIVKSVCDFANTDKNDEWQSYAAYTSASYAIKLIQCELFVET
jgi:nucleoside phosphorylase